MKAQKTPDFAGAMRLLNKGEALRALDVGDKLVSSNSENDRLSGFLCRGWVYEEGGGDLQPDLDKSFYNFMQVTLMAPDSLSFGNLARVSMKIGGKKGYSDAKRYLIEAAKIGVTPEVMLGFAHYYRVGPDKNLDRAKGFYLRAALHGRYAGFFGYSEVARELGQGFRALVVDCFRIILGPFIAVLIGARAQNRF